MSQIRNAMCLCSSCSANSIGILFVHSWKNVPKSETNFWKQCIITEQWNTVMTPNFAHKIVHSSAMYYQNLIMIHECSKKLLKMKNSKSFFFTPSIYMYFEHINPHWLLISPFLIVSLMHLDPRGGGGGVLPYVCILGMCRKRDPHFQPWISAPEHIIFKNLQKIRSGASPFYIFWQILPFRRPSFSKFL